MTSVVRLSAQVHKWISLIVGVQVIFWVVGGLVMVSIPIERVRGEHHIRQVAVPPLPLTVLPLAEVAARTRSRPTEGRLVSTLRGPVWILRTGNQPHVTVSALTGAALPAMTEAEARAAATAASLGEGAPVSAAFFSTPPKETGKTSPVWRVDFEDAEHTSFYISPATGEVETRRSALWRAYDFMWRLHILDVKDGENFNTPLLWGVTAMTLLLLITGLVLLVSRLRRDFRTR